MCNKRYDEWYFYDSCDKFLNEIDFVYNTYINCFENIFSEPEKEALKYEEYLNEHLEEVCVNDEIDIPSEIQSMVYHKYILVKNMKYRHLATYISMIYQMFEQFILSLAKHQQKFISHDYKINDLKLEYLRHGIKMLKEYNFDITILSEYKKIDELRLLYNVIKHGDGDSKKELEKIRADFFVNNGLDMFDNTIINDTLNISKTDLDTYINSIKKLLNQFPDKIIHEYYI